LSTANVTRSPCTILKSAVLSSPGTHTKSANTAVLSSNLAVILHNVLRTCIAKSRAHSISILSLYLTRQIRLAIWQTHTFRWGAHVCYLILCKSNVEIKSPSWRKES